MSTVRRFLTSYQELDTMAAGLFQKADGTVWIRNPDGSTDEVGGASPGGSGIVVIGPFPASFDDAGLADGIEFYTPTVGDVLYDAWVEVVTVFDGTTPKLDIGSFVGTSDGIFAELGSTTLRVDIGASGETAGAGLRRPPGSGAVPYSLQSGAGYAGAGSGWGIFTAAHPLKVVVSQDGSAGGGDPGSTQGEIAIYLAVVTPVAP